MLYNILEETCRLQYMVLNENYDFFYYIIILSSFSKAQQYLNTHI